MKSYIVNLPRSRDRRENILAECARFGLEAEIFPAVYGAGLTDGELRERVDGLALDIFSRAEIGCCLSHLGIYRDMIEKDVPVAFVLEDDAVFLDDPRPVLDGLAEKAGASPEVYLLTLNRTADQCIDGARPLRVGGRLFHRGWRGFGAYGYVITRAAAANILAVQRPMKFACDWWKIFQNVGAIRLFLCDAEIVGIHRELGEASLIAPERGPGQRRRRKLYILRQTPVRHTILYYLRKIWYGRRIKRV